MLNHPNSPLILTHPACMAMKKEDLIVLEQVLILYAELLCLEVCT